MHILDQIRLAKAAGDAAGNPIVHIGITGDLERSILTDIDVFNQIETLDRRLMGVPYTAIEGEWRWVAIHLSDLQRK